MNEPVVSFTAMAAGTRADYDLVAEHDASVRAAMGDRVLDWLRSMDGPSPYRISRLDHCLQSATRAENDGADDETVACALLHDIGDVIGPANHSEVGAALLRPYVTERNWWIVGHHGLFQGYYWFHHYGRSRDERDRYADHQWYDATVAFCEDWDQNCFDPAFSNRPLGHFEPLVRDLFARPPADYV